MFKNLFHDGKDYLGRRADHHWSEARPARNRVTERDGNIGQSVDNDYLLLSRPRRVPILKPVPLTPGFCRRRRERKNRNLASLVLISARRQLSGWDHTRSGGFVPTAITTGDVTWLSIFNIQAVGRGGRPFLPPLNRRGSRAIYPPTTNFNEWKLSRGAAGTGREALCVTALGHRVHCPFSGGHPTHYADRWPFWSVTLTGWTGA